MELINWQIPTSSCDADNTCFAVGVTGSISLLGNNRSWSVASTLVLVLVVLLIEYRGDEDEFGWDGISWDCESGACTWKDICW